MTYNLKRANDNKIFPLKEILAKTKGTATLDYPPMCNMKNILLNGHFLLTKDNSMQVVFQLTHLLVQRAILTDN